MTRSRLFCLWQQTKEYRWSWTVVTGSEKVYQEVSEWMAAHGYRRTMKQCREKLKKLESDYWSIKNHNGRHGSTRRCWKRFNHLLAPHQRATGGIVTSTPPLHCWTRSRMNPFPHAKHSPPPSWSRGFSTSIYSAQHGWPLLDLTSKRRQEDRN